MNPAQIVMLQGMAANAGRSNAVGGASKGPENNNLVVVASLCLIAAGSFATMIVHYNF